MRIALCTVPHLGPVPNLDKFASFRPPKIAIMSLIKWMERNGYPKDTYDYYDIDAVIPEDHELEAYFRDYNPTVVGLSAVVSTSYNQVKRVSRIIRKVCPDAWIVVGGNITAAANTILHRTDVDICVIGNGEIAWVKFLDYVKENGRRFDYEKLSSIPGLTFLDESKTIRFNGEGETVPNSEITVPDLDIMKLGLRHKPEMIKRYFADAKRSAPSHPRFQDPDGPKKAVFIWTSKGCVSKCTFCQRSFKGYATSPLDQLEVFLRRVKEEYDVGYVNFADENFGSDRKFAREVAELLKRLDIYWGTGGVRAVSLNREDLEFYKANNCAVASPGFETGSQTILDIMEKKMTVSALVDSFNAIADLEVDFNMTAMVGMPGETESTVLETGAFLGALAHRIGVHPQHLPVAIAYALPFPGTPLYRYGQMIGIFGTSPEDEEAYLSALSTARFNKRSYVNLNGAPVKEVLFWDVLIAMEASRVFRQKMKERPATPTAVGKVYEKAFTSGWDGLSTTSLRHRFHRWLLNSPFIDSLPRWIVYPAAKNLLYVKHIMRVIYYAISGKEPYFIFARRKAKDAEVLKGRRLRPDLVLGKTKREISLRTILSKFQGLAESEEQKAIRRLSAGA